MYKQSVVYSEKEDYTEMKKQTNKKRKTKFWCDMSEYHYIKH